MGNNVEQLARSRGIGTLPTFGEFATPMGLAALAGTFSAGAYPLYSATGNIPLSALCGMVSSLVVWGAERYHRHGGGEFHPLTDVPVVKEHVKRVGGMDARLTGIYREVFKTDEVMVEVRESSQYRVHVIYHDDLPIWTKMAVLARKIGIKSKPGQKGSESIPVVYIDVFEPGASAIMIPKHKSEWGDTVVLRQDILRVGIPVVHLGDAVDGTPMLADFRIEHGMLVAGTSGSGKTEVFVAAYKSLESAGLVQNAIIIDLKGTPQLSRVGAAKYITRRMDEHSFEFMELEEMLEYIASSPALDDALSELARINADLMQRMRKYMNADCDNIWAYRKKVDPNEQPIVLFIDELAVLSRISDKQKRDAAMSLLASIAQVGRSGGLILTVGMQHPIADDLPTTIRNQLMIRCVLAVADGKAAEVTGIQGAQNQPMQGGMMLRHAGDLQIGRGVYLS